MLATEAQQETLTRVTAEKAALESQLRTTVEDLEAARAAAAVAAASGTEASAELEQAKAEAARREDELRKELEAANNDKENLSTQVNEVCFSRICLSARLPKYICHIFLYARVRVCLYVSVQHPFPCHYLRKCIFCSLAL